MERIQIARDGKGFVQAPSGRPFIPWGFNYDRDYKLRLIEEYWEAEWATVAADFAEMKRLGANVVRVHLQFDRFIDGPDRPNRRALDRLGNLLALAETTGLYLDLTGLGGYRKSAAPAWYDALNESARWNTQARFWEAIADRCARSPAVFCYDLINEPVVPGEKRKPGEWLTGELAGFTYVQFITLDPTGRPRSEIARKWIAKLAGAIRRRDPRRLITVGLLPNSREQDAYNSGFVPEKIAPELDFLCVHLYPDGKKLREDLQLLKDFRAPGKPVVIEEMFPIHCSIAEMETFIAASRESASGWVGFYWGQTLEELKGSSAIGDALTRGWLEVFAKRNPNRL